MNSQIMGGLVQIILIVFGLAMILNNHGFVRLILKSDYTKHDSKYILFQRIMVSLVGVFFIVISLGTFLQIIPLSRHR